MINREVNAFASENVLSHFAPILCIILEPAADSVDRSGNLHPVKLYVIMSCRKCISADPAL